MHDSLEPRPEQARDAREFMAMLRALKQSSGLTFRQLEERAAANGDVLARSTLADTLRRSSLPHPSLLTAFVRVCGAGGELTAWLTALSRIAATEHGAAPIATPTFAPTFAPTTAPSLSPATLSGPASGHASSLQPSVPLAGAEVTAPMTPPSSAGPAPRWWSRRRLGLAVGALVVLLAGAVVGLVIGLGSHSPTRSPGVALSPGVSLAPPAPSASRAPVTGQVTIRPARQPNLCVTAGNERNNSYPSIIAVLAVCVREPEPTIYLVPTDNGLVLIQWRDPVEGTGCLAELTDGGAAGMFQPQNDCSTATQFSLARAGGPIANAYRIVVASSGLCLSINGNIATAGAEAIEEPCTGQASQEFLLPHA
jgi:hypothetical protein